MILNELFEDNSKHVAFCFGRMNPPTIGHARVFETLKSVGGDYKIFVTLSQDKKENPLDYPTKLKFIKSIHPNYASHVEDNPTLNTIGKVCSYLYDQGYRNATFVAGSDRLPNFQKLISDYNGVEGKAHGYYKFETLDFKSSGERDPDSPGVEGVSASKARERAANNDLEGFAEATGAGAHAKALFNAVRKGMGIKDEVEEDISRRGFLRGIGAAAAGAAGIGAVNKAQAQVSGEDTLPDIVAHVKFKVNEKEITKDINLGTTYKSPREAAEALEKFMKSKGIKYFDYTLERVKPKDDDYMDAKPYQVKESPIEMDPSEPMNPMIHSHDKANPAKLKYRMLRAAGQLKDLAARAENASPGEWEIMARQFEELKMNMEQIRHALEELGKVKRKGGIRSRGITV
jgi:hypothetical protein